MISLVLTLIVVGVLLWLLYAFGILDLGGDIRVPQLR